MMLTGKPPVLECSSSARAEKQVSYIPVRCGVTSRRLVQAVTCARPGSRGPGVPGRTSRQLSAPACGDPRPCGETACAMPWQTVGA